MSNLAKRNNLLSLPSVSTFIDDFFSKNYWDWADKKISTFGSSLPSANLKETDKKIQIELAVPGMKKEDFKIEIDNNTLFISAEKEEEKEESKKNDNYIRKEFSYQSFFRSFTLPEYIDDENIEANYKDGILHVEVAKKEGTKKKSGKKIEIQ
jgi:HSP20 family protein